MLTRTAVVNTINDMIDEAGSGETIFYDFYTDQQKQSDPTKESTGLFFFRGKPGAPFAVISPGGGFSYVGSVHEGFPHAIALSQKGYNAFVLQYRVGGERIAAEDLAAALSYIFENAETLEVSTERLLLWGSSAGARMAARIGSYGAAAYGGDRTPPPKYSRHGLYWAYGLHRRRSANFCRGGRQRWNSQCINYGKACEFAAKRGG